MKQYYESEVLFQLMERDGLNIPSSVPPYEAEIKAYLINQVKQAYPKLTDYEAEWLLYNYAKHLPADFPISSVSNVTEATFENVVPYAYQSAILRGCTLVNAKPKTPIIVAGTETAYNENTGICSFNTNKGNLDFSNALLKPSTKYLAVVEIIKVPNYVIEHSSPLKITLGNMEEKFININKDEIQIGIVKKTMTTSSNIKDNLTLSFRGEFSTPVEFKVMILEYQDGMENWDIPYFDGMQSVKMPVLTTSNEDGTKTNILTVNEDVTLRGIGDVQDTLDCLRGELTQKVENVLLTGDEVIELWSTTSTEHLRFFIQYDGVKEASGICNKFINFQSQIISNSNFESIACIKNGFTIVILKNRLNQENVDGFKQWVKDNSVSITYQLEQEVNKTVELTTVNENGESVHFMPLEGTMNVHSSGENIPPTFDMSVPVEATTQNLASFVDLQMEE